MFALMFLGGILGWHRWELRRVESDSARFKSDWKSTVDGVIAREARHGEFLVKQAALSLQVSHAISNHDSGTMNEVAKNLMDQGEADALVIFDSNGHLLFEKSGDGAGFQNWANSLDSVSVRDQFVQHGSPWFWTRTDQGLIEVRGAIVSRPAGAGGVTEGLVYAARVWNETLTQRISKDIGGWCAVRETNMDSSHTPTYSIPIPDVNGHSIGQVDFASDSDPSSELKRTAGVAVTVFAVCSLGLLGMMFLATYYWVVRPLNWTSTILRTGDLKLLEDLEHASSEFGQVAGLMRMFLAQRDVLERSKHELEMRVNERTAELREAYEATIEGWSRALEFRDQETEGHCRRVTLMSLRLAQEVGIEGDELVQLKRGALLHDIGKMGIPDSILLKPGKLTDEERTVMEQHTIYAYQMLEPIKFLRAALDIPLYHHEKWDGTGYPYKLKGTQIPLSARLFAIVDVWDALRSDRPYRQAWDEKRVTDYLVENSGSHFDPDLIQAFLKVSDLDKTKIRESSVRRAA